MKPLAKQHGFSIMMAIFILVVLSLMSLYMLRLFGNQNATLIHSLQGSRAYHAARSGMEWGIYRVSEDKNCTATEGANLNFPALNGFNVNLNCTALGSYQEDINRSVFKITSHAAFADFEDPDHAYRQLEVTLVLDD